MLRPALVVIVASLAAEMTTVDIIEAVNRQCLPHLNALPTPANSYSWGAILAELKRQGYRPTTVAVRGRDLYHKPVFINHPGFRKV